MERVPEPELMLAAEQARAYASADFSEPHEHFIALLRERFPELPRSGRALDLGCGPADISLRFARVYEAWHVDGVDGSPAMLALGRAEIARHELDARLRLHELRLPAEALPGTGYDCVFSNSLLHHLHQPDVLWSSVRSAVRPGGCVFVMDLMRPSSRDEARSLVEHYAAAEPDVLREDFFHSLLAAFRPEEVRDQLRGSGLASLELEVTSDRHFIVWGHAR